MTASSSHPSIPHQAIPSKQSLSQATTQYPDDYRPIVDDEDVESIPSTATRGLALWNAHSSEQEKENRPTSIRQVSKKPSLLDRQPGAHKVSWDDYSQEVSADRKRNHPPQEESEDSNVSQDEGFQNDERIPNPTLREAAPPARHRARSTDKRPPKRVRVDSPEAKEYLRRERELMEELLQASAGPQSDEEDAEEDIPRPTFEEVKHIGQQNRARRRQALPSTQRPTQKRIPWSKADEMELIDVIENHGTSWTLVQDIARLEVPRGQVQLKDKARNIKVDYLR